MSKFLKSCLAWLVAFLMIAVMTGCDKNKEENLSQDGTPEIGGQAGNIEIGNADPEDLTASKGENLNSSVQVENPDAPVSSNGQEELPPSSNVPQSGENFEEDGFEGSAGGESPSVSGEGNSSSEEIPPIEEPVNQKNEIQYDETLAKEYEDYLAMTLDQKVQFQKDRFNEDPKAFREWRNQAQNAYDDKKASESYSGSLDLGELLKKDK